MPLVPELFSGGCDRVLPVGTIVDRYELSHLIPLRVRLGDLVVPVVVVPFEGELEQTAAPFFDRGLHRRNDGSIHSFFSTTGGVNVEDVVAKKVERSLEPLVEKVEIASATEVLADGQLDLPGGKRRFRMRADLARSLLEGKPALVDVVEPDGRVRRVEVVVAHAAADDMPVSLTVSDLPSFLERPIVQVGRGRSMPIDLPKPKLRELISTGRTTTKIGGTQVELNVGNGEVATAQYSIISTSAPGTSDQPTPPPGEAIPERDLGTLPLALHIPVRQEWELLGYSRGALLHSVALAPQEELTLEVFSWDRRTTTSEDTATTESGATIESSTTSRDTSEALSELGRTSELRNNIGGNIGFSGYGVTVGVTGGVTDGNSVNDTARRTVGDLHESVVKSTTQIKATRQVKVTEGTEIGREERVTRRIRNPNTCRALAVDTFEILAHYRITTKILRAEAQPAVLIEIPLPFAFFNRSRVRQYESVLSAALLEPALRDGFAAARLLAERDYACQVACERCLCGDTNTLLLRADVSDAVTKVQNAARQLAAANPRVAFSWVDVIVNKRSDGVIFDPSLLAPEVHRWMYASMLGDESDALYRALIYPGITSGLDTVTVARSILTAMNGINPDNLTASKLYTKWRIQLEQHIFQRYLNENFDAPSGSDNGKSAVVNEVRRRFSIFGEDAGLQSALKAFMTAAAPPPAPTTNASDPVASAYSVTEVAGALEREEALLAHLNDNRDYYRVRVFLSMPLDTQRELLRARGFDVPGIALRPLGREGSLLAYPILPTLTPALREYFANIVANNAALDAPVGTTDVELPTPGIHLQTRLSECDACEPYLQGVRDAEVLKREAEAKAAAAKALQEESEAERLKKRLGRNKPLLGSPFAQGLPAIKVVLETPPKEEPPP